MKTVKVWTLFQLARDPPSPRPTDVGKHIRICRISVLFYCIFQQVNYSSPTAHGAPNTWSFGSRLEHPARGDPPTVAKLGKLHGEEVGIT